MRIFCTDHEIDMDIPEKYLFLGDCQGIALVPRGPDDNHICFIILTEDDEQWYASNGSASSYWVDDLAEQLKLVREWLEKNAFKEKHGYGYKFKRKSRKGW